MTIFLIFLWIMLSICIFMLGYWFGSVSTNNNMMLAIKLANEKDALVATDDEPGNITGKAIDERWGK